MGGKSSKSKEEEAGGKPLEYDPAFNGPVKNRGCTDALCCIFFTVFIIAFIAVGIYAFAMGDPRLLVYPIDSDGNMCGYATNEGKTFLFFFDFAKCFSVSSSAINILKMCQGSKQICVESCPDEYWTSTFGSISQAICANGYKPNNSTTLQTYINKELCAPYYVPTNPIVYRCLPKIPGLVLDTKNKTVKDDSVKKGIDVIQELINLQGYGVKILADVASTWWLILLFILLSMVLALIWIVLMRWISGVMVWLTILLFIGFFVFGIYYSFDRYTDLKNHDSNATFVFTTNFQYYSNLKETWLALGIIASIVLFVILVILLFLIKRIRIAIALIKETSRAISHMMFTLLWPLFPFVLQIVVIVYWGGSAICLAAVSRTNGCQVIGNDSTVTELTGVRCKLRGLMQDIPCDPSALNGTSAELCNSLKNGFKDDRYTLVLQAFQLFVWFWLMNFIIALGQVTLAGAFSSYYWAFDKSSDIPTFPIVGSFYRAVRYHMGSMAFGALLIAIVKLIILILEYLDHKLKDRVHIVARCILKCLICCFWCLEKFLKFLNKNAYIIIAVHGTNFCSSAAKAFNLILRNALRVFVVDKVTDILLFINKLFIVGSVGVFAYFTFSGLIPGYASVIHVQQLNYYLIPILIVICGSYVVASVFFSVYDMGVDTLFLCFLEDLERNDGSSEKPYFMSKNLMDILGKSNKLPPNYNKVNSV